MASVNGQSVTISCKLTAAVTRGRFVRINGANGGIPVATQSTDGSVATGHANVGIALTSGVAGDIIDVQIDGLCSFATAGASLTLGALVTTDANGKVVAAASGDRAIGRIISGKDGDASTADGEECIVHLGFACDVA